MPDGDVLPEILEKQLSVFLAAKLLYSSRWLGSISAVVPFNFFNFLFAVIQKFSMLFVCTPVTGSLKFWEWLTVECWNRGLTSMLGICL